MMVARMLLLMASLLIPCTTAAGTDPVKISLRGTTIERLPNAVIVVTKQPEQEWKAFLIDHDASTVSDLDEARETGIFSAMRRGIRYEFCKSEAFGESRELGDVQLPDSALVYLWYQGTGPDHVGYAATPDVLAKAHQLELISEKESERATRWLYRSAEGAFIAFLREEYLVCPMHPGLPEGDAASCEICGMSKLPAWHVPRERLSDERDRPQAR